MEGGVGTEYQTQACQNGTLNQNTTPGHEGFTNSFDPQVTACPEEEPQRFGADCSQR